MKKTPSANFFHKGRKPITGARTCDRCGRKTTMGDPLKQIGRDQWVCRDECAERDAPDK